MTTQLAVWLPILQVQLRDYKHAFKPLARTLLLLGDQLIRDAGIAVFELVKNAYDADSPTVTIMMEGVAEPRTGKIVVQDSGTGMDYDTVVGVWLEPGTDYRVHQRTENERTPRYKRTPLGEKGSDVSPRISWEGRSSLRRVRVAAPRWWWRSTGHASNPKNIWPMSESA
jgi:Histidine kinase-, DNA gyrase B-, and HSP90-like ATPase